MMNHEVSLGEVWGGWFGVDVLGYGLGVVWLLAR